MSVSGLSTNPANTALASASAQDSLPSNLQAIVGSYNMLGRALQSGNLAGAQQAFVNLLQSNPSNTGTPASGSSIIAQSPQATAVNAAFAKVGQALQSSDLAGAQQAFAKLQATLKTAEAQLGTQAAGGGSAAGSSAAASSATGAGAASGGTASSSTVTSQVTTTNSDGTITTTITYADGTTASTTEANPTGTVSKSALDPTNSGQLFALLTAQEQAQPG